MSVPNQGPGFWQVVKSVAASAFGVQSEKNRIQDFEQSQSIVPYAVVGVVFVILFIVGIMLVVNLAIS